ncbi:MAG: cysteine--tRNA ligase [Phycisphaerae bacterium]|nr:cysteine--tRNA ligase [Phycisphaerae bacterium]
MTLRVYNTLSGEKELFESVRPGAVGIYLCGPTVYKPAHIGHAVGPVIFDVIKRYLTFKSYKVTWVVNVTDVEDKLINEARKQGRGVMELARDLEEQYIGAMGALGVKSIDYMPRASEHIQDIIDHIDKLIKINAAYSVDGDVYFDVSKDADYGKLSHRKPEEQFAGTRDGLVQGKKRNPGDFALWKAAKPDEPDDVVYRSPWGRGRPGWHIECSAMASKYLGETFDIHGGGMDLKFPHHENEIAQSETAYNKPFAKYWLHNGLTRFNTKKVSKSDPEFEKVMASLQLSNLLTTHPPELLRFLIISSHYRSPIDFSDEALAACKSGLSTFHRLMERLERASGVDPYRAEVQIEHVREQAVDTATREFVEKITNLRVRFLEAMDDDFNTAGAIGVLFDTASAINRFIDASRIETQTSETATIIVRAAGGSFTFMANLLGLLTTKPTAKVQNDSLTPKLVELLIAVRKMARDAKQFEIGDHIRAEMSKLGIALEDRKDGTQWRIE